jgi:hypothetical protein
LRADRNLFILPAVFSSLIWGGPDWPDDEDEAEEMLKRFGRDVRGAGSFVPGLPGSQIATTLEGLAVHRRGQGGGS